MRTLVDHRLRAVHTWTVIRYLHLLGLIFFVGGQLMLVTAVAPVVRRQGGEEAMLAVARRFGIGSAIALVALVATGAAMASHYDLWDSSTLHVKLALIVGIFLLTGAHVVRPQTRALSLVMLALSLVIVYLGLKLTWG
jgi:uncharacterized membrane protein